MTISDRALAIAAKVEIAYHLERPLSLIARQKLTVLDRPSAVMVGPVFADQE